MEVCGIWQRVLFLTRLNAILLGGPVSCHVAHCCPGCVCCAIADGLHYVPSVASLSLCHVNTKQGCGYNEQGRVPSFDFLPATSIMLLVSRLKQNY